MKLLTNSLQQPLLQTNTCIINLNTLQEVKEVDDVIPVKAGLQVSISKHKNNEFIQKAKRIFSVSRMFKGHGITWYKLESKVMFICIIQGDSLQLLGNYPIYYLKLIYRYINTL